MHHFVFVNTDGKEYSVSIIDLSGKAVITSSIKDNDNALNVSELENGMYILTLSNLNGETVARQKVIVKH